VAIERQLAASIERQLAAARARREAADLPNADTNAYRLLHGAGDGVEGLSVDVYDQFLVASLYTEQRGAREEAWLHDLAALGYRGLYVKQRPKQASRLDAGERRERAPEQPAWGEAAPLELIIREHGVAYAVRLGDGLSTGLFLDQRDNRARFAREAAGKRVLNLFAYTCAFGLVAARAGAAHTTNLDVAKGALERGRRNYELSGIDPTAHAFLARDALDALPRLARRGDTFDLIALDPPSFASTQRGVFSVERDYARLAGQALALLAPGGTLLACTNHARLGEQDLRRMLEQAAAAGPRTNVRIELCGPPADHPAAPDRPPHLKTAWVRTG
jgi:23S rRNA (cytosine1962-C5)-methyltransferase